MGLPILLRWREDGALPEEMVVCDWRWQYPDEYSGLSTALQDELPVLVLNLNNRYQECGKQWQDMIYSGRHSQSYMESLPDFVAACEAYGHVGHSHQRAAGAGVEAGSKRWSRCDNQPPGVRRCDGGRQR